MDTAGHTTADAWRRASAVAQPRLHYLDGIRGAAALYVLIFHSLGIVVTRPSHDVSLPLRLLARVFSQGHFAVCVFIVLSGFSLMLPVARGGRSALPAGFRHYLYRRSRRILPAYYAALVISLLGIVVVKASGDVATSAGGYDVALSPGSVVSHFLLLHNLSFDWVFRINGPLWSVATEWQIYFLFPLALLPLWRRVGGAATIAIVWGLALLLHFAVPSEQNLYWAAPWFVGSFALGMWGAAVLVDERRTAERLRALPWGLIACALFAAIAAMVGTGNDDLAYPVEDLLVSLFALALILACASARNAGTVTIARWFSSRPMMLLGAFSYSIYLLQHPFLRLSEKVLDRSPFGYEPVLWIQLAIGTPIMLAVAWCFAELFEFPFTRGSRVTPVLRRLTTRFGWLGRTPQTAPAPNEV